MVDNTNINYQIPLNKLKNMYSNNNNMIILVYGYKNEVISIINNSEFIEPGYNAIDYNGNDISNLVVTQTNLDITNVGNYEMLYIATDLFGYQSVESRSINVKNDSVLID